MNSSFLSRNNINNVYQQLQQGILKHSQFDLNSDPTYRKIVKNMLHMVHKHHNVDTSTLQSLNTLAFQKITPYMLQIVSQGGILRKQKTQTTNNETNKENNQNITSIDESVFSEIKDENAKMLEENVHIAQQKTEEEIFKNAYASNTNDILHTIEEDTQNLIDPANTGALDSSYVMPGVEVSASGHNYETINVDFDDPSISNLTPKALNVVNTKKEKEEFTNQEDFQESRKKQELDETQENFSFQISKQNELKKQTELLKNLKNVFGIETFQNQEIVEKACFIEIHKLKKPVGKQDQYLCGNSGLNAFKFHENDLVDKVEISLSKEKVIKRLSKDFYLIPTNKQRSSDIVLSKIKLEEQVKEKILEIRKIAEKFIIFEDEREDKIEQKFHDSIKESWKIKRSMSNVMTEDLDDQYELINKLIPNNWIRLIGAGKGGYFLVSSKKKERDLHDIFEHKGIRGIFKASISDEGIKSFQL